MGMMEMLSVILALAMGILTVAVLYVQNLISTRNEGRGLLLKYNQKKLCSAMYEDAGEGQEKNGQAYLDNTENELLKILEAYHNQAIKQADIQFWFSIIAAVLGFALISVVIIWGEGETWYENVLQSLPGTIVEIISVLFIKQAKATRERATELFRELNYDNKIEMSIGIADSIDNADTKSEIKAKIALHIIDLDDVPVKEAHVSQDLMK